MSYAEDVFACIEQWKQEKMSRKEFAESCCAENTERELFLIVGLDRYPKLVNTQPLKRSMYDIYSLGEVAFFTNDYNLSLFCIVSLLFHSNDRANEFINLVNSSSSNVDWADVAGYLEEKKNLILINAKHINKNQTTRIKKLLKKYKNHKVLFVGKTHKIKKYSPELTNYMIINHCSGRSFAKSSKECCQTYFDFNAQGTQQVNLSDFKAF